MRNTNTLTKEEWEQYHDLGYISLGVVYPEEKIDELCDRIDEIMLGNISYEGMKMQVCPSAYGEKDGTSFTTEPPRGSLKFRKIQELEMDPLFLAYIQHPLFRHISRELIGERISIFRAMFFNKPANGGVPLVWHQDGRSWNLNKYPEMTIYTALDKATKANGCVQIVPNSHRECTVHTVESEEDIARFAPPENRHFLEMEKGEVVMFKAKTLHSSLVNTTDRPRRAFSIGFIDSDSYNVKTHQRYPLVFPHYEPIPANG
ncbi:MAG: phytanoyl-CoA dioxygenase family protein [Planctomycetota bacterium]|nr:phytanoyl-CoA dioxygenase family protein [Planctomycetota bacterium]